MVASRLDFGKLEEKLGVISCAPADGLELALSGDALRLVGTDFPDLFPIACRARGQQRLNAESREEDFLRQRVALIAVQAKFIKKLRSVGSKNAHGVRVIRFEQKIHRAREEPVSEAW